jgi:molecular chaperone HtpG
MAKDPFKTTLLRYLECLDKVYYGKCGELREAIQGWLSYIPQSFPHYTRHTIEHSNEIISQLSQLLFRDDDPERPSVKLSAAEAYILVASAFLHDAGMVVSDAEKSGILGSDDWKQWTTGDGGGAKRSREVDALREDPRIPDERIRYFLADIQIRFLIAEFVRRTHHQNAAHLLTQHQSSLARFAFDDAILLRTITDVCVAHGLHQIELLDRDRFPDHREVRGDAVNVRLMAILLRLGDLLDLSHDRACALLLLARAGSLIHRVETQGV